MAALFPTCFLFLGFLCPLNANVYNIDFLSFEIKDYETKRVIFEVNKDAAASALPADFDFSQLDESVYRKIKYDFSVDVLRLPNIQTVYVFVISLSPPLSISYFSFIICCEYSTICILHSHFNTFFTPSLSLCIYD